MRRQRYLRASSAQSLCIFCACRLAGDLVPSVSRPIALTSNRRRVHTTTQSRQQASVAVARESGLSGASNQAPEQWTGFDPNSSLTLSEQRERARLREIREGREREERQRRDAALRQQENVARAIAEERKAQLAKEQEELARASEQWKKEQDQLKASRAHRDQSAQQNERLQGIKRPIFRKTGVENHLAGPRANNGHDADSPFRVAANPQQLSFRPQNFSRVQLDQSHQQDGARTSSNDQRELRFGQYGRQQQETSAGPQQRLQGRNTRRADLSAQPLPPKVAAPDFLRPAEEQTAKMAVADDGWGSGVVERAPLHHGDGPAARDEEPPTINDNIQTAEGPPDDVRHQDKPFNTPHVSQVEPGHFGARTVGGYGNSRHMKLKFSGARNSDRASLSTHQEEPPRQQQRGEDPFLATLRGGARHREDDHGDFGSTDQLRAAFDSPSGIDDTIPRPYRQQEQSRLRRDPFGSDAGFGGRRQDSRFGSAPDRRDGRGNDGREQRPVDLFDNFGPHTKQPRRIPSGHEAFDEIAAREDLPSYDEAFGGHNEEQQEMHNQEMPPPPPASSNERQRYSSSGYRATMFDPQDYQRNQSDFDEAQAANWQHLRRRKSEPASPPPASRQQQQQQQQSGQQYSLDDNFVDRMFQQHQQERQQQYAMYPQRQSRQQEQSPFDPAFNPGIRKSMADRRCGRCGEQGHIASDCTGPWKTKCHVCQQVGHSARHCPMVGDGREQQQRPGLVRDVTGQQERSGDAPAFRRTQSQGPGPFDGHGEAQETYRDSHGLRRESRRGDRDDRQDAVSELQARVLRGPRGDEAAAEEQDHEEEGAGGDEGNEEKTVPVERVLRSRKFTDEAPKREKVASRGRRRNEDEDEEDDYGVERDERNARKAARKAEKQRKEEAKYAQHAEKKAKQAEARSQLPLPEFISVANLAQALGVRYESFVSRLERLGYDDVFPGKVLNAETSGMIAMEYDFEPVFESTAPSADERDLRARPEVEDKTFLPTRPPVVTIMGHVDHGKTTILDYLRNSSVAAGEAGGITQHIGAFSVPLASSGKTITFLDTPGHAAFLAMRQRGAHVTDIVILVVAADDSVKPQTLEAIKHAKAAGVPMIVAVNKMDKPEADLQRVKQDLARHGVDLEDYGGETQVVPVSGKTGLGMEELEENVVTLSEILDHRAETEGMVEGWVLEATTKKAGRVATVLVRRGTLKVGAVIVAGKTWARVRTLRDEKDRVLKEIGPGMPVEVDGWRDQPQAGDEVLQAPSEQKANDAVEFRVEREERERTAQDMEAINEARRLEQEKREKGRAEEAAAKQGQEYFEAASKTDDAAAEEEQSGQMSVPFIIKADVSGSAEAVSAYILSVASPLIAPRILRSQVGSINESDVELAAAAQGHIIAFNLPADEGMKGAAEARGVKVLENNIIYRVLDDVKAVLEDKLPPIVTQKVVGEAEVGAAFEINLGRSKKMKIAGCKVRNGVIGRGSRVRVMRGSEKIYDGTISSLKNVKKDVQEMRKGTECGMGFEGWEAFEVGDQVQTYAESEEKRRL